MSSEPATHQRNWFERRIARMKRPPRRAIPTRPGIFVLGAPVILGVAAISASNNLLMIMVGASLASIIVSGLMSEINLFGLSARVRQIGPIHAGDDARLEIVLDRAAPHDRRPAYGLRIRELSSMLDMFRARDPSRLDATLPVLEGNQATFTGRRVFPNRGRVSLGVCEVVTTYPFGFLWKARDLDTKVDVVVRPRRIDAPAALAHPRRWAEEGDASNRRGAGVEFYALREREDRDSLLRVHALRSLTLGRDVVVDPAGMEKPTAHLGIENDSNADPEAFERTLEVAASVVRAWDGLGYAVGMTTRTEVYPAGENGVDALLDALATLTPVAGQGAAPPERLLWLCPVGGPTHPGAAVIDAEGNVRGGAL